MVMQARPLGIRKTRLTCCRRVCFLRVWVWGLLVFEGLLGFFLLWAASAAPVYTSCILRDILRFFNKFLLLIKKKGLQVLFL
jgi:hypothetical protein